MEPYAYQQLEQPKITNIVIPVNIGRFVDPDVAKMIETGMAMPATKFNELQNKYKYVCVGSIDAQEETYNLIMCPNRQTFYLWSAERRRAWAVDYTCARIQRKTESCTKRILGCCSCHGCSTYISPECGAVNGVTILSANINGKFLDCVEEVNYKTIRHIIGLMFAEMKTPFTQRKEIRKKYNGRLRIGHVDYDRVRYELISTGSRYYLWNAQSRIEVPVDIMYDVK